MFQITYSKTMAPTTLPSRSLSFSLSKTIILVLHLVRSTLVLQSVTPSLPIPIWYHRRLLYMPTYWHWLRFSCTHTNPLPFTGCMWLPLEFTTLSAGPPLPLQQWRQTRLRLAALAHPLPRHGPCHATPGVASSTDGLPTKVSQPLLFVACEYVLAFVCADDRK